MEAFKVADLDKIKEIMTKANYKRLPIYAGSNYLYAIPPLYGLENCTWTALTHMLHSKQVEE